MKAYLGIDTSCYTTSCALIAENGKLISEARKILDVKPGRCGLQQSEMVFQHTRNLPDLIEQAMVALHSKTLPCANCFCSEGCEGSDGCGADLNSTEYELAGIGVSGYPRRQEGSYMPAFLAGMSVARSLACTMNLPLTVLSHQENHIAAGVWSAGGPEVERFLALHASGGTTDLLLVEYKDKQYKIEQIGGSIDLHAGQFVDRIGVALGLQFPTGPALEKLASTATAYEELPISVRKLEVSLSGPCTAAQRKLEAGVDGAKLALGVEYCLAETFARLFRKAAEQYHLHDVLLVGGVGCNSYIRKHLEARLAQKRIKLWVPEGRFSCDNATGCANYARLTDTL